MSDWIPLSESKMYDYIYRDEAIMVGELWNFWKQIKIPPSKWVEKEYGTMGGGFWAVAVCGTNVIWYNDIEEGFNISKYETYGHITEYWCDQDDLLSAVTKLHALIKVGGDIQGQAWPPQKLD